uniref:Uncharacterized protein n=1 Tax=Rhizophora mucronata TaxID=61149 RepID=A0A2P2NSI9_RHIMU
MLCKILASSIRRLTQISSQDFQDLSLKNFGFRLIYHKENKLACCWPSTHMQLLQFLDLILVFLSVPMSIDVHGLCFF